METNGAVGHLDTYEMKAINIFSHLHEQDVVVEVCAAVAVVVVVVVVVVAAAAVAVAATAAVLVEVSVVAVAVVVSVEYVLSKLLSAAFVALSVPLMLPGTPCAAVAVGAPAVSASSFEGFSFQVAVEVVLVEVAG